MNVDLKEYAAKVGAMDSSVYLGRLCWYSVPSDLSVDHREVVGTLVALGLDHALPYCPLDVDVFRRVSTAAKRNKVPTIDPGVFENFMIREVSGTGGGSVVRRVVVERVNPEGKRLDYFQLCDVEYDRGTNRIDVTILDDGVAHAETAAMVVAEIRSEFDLWRGSLNAYNVREWIRHTILGLGGTNVRPKGGGVYFVKEEHHDKLESLEVLAATLSNGIDIHSLPLIDDGKQRAMVRRAFEAESVDAIDGMLMEIKQLTDDGRQITTDRYASYVTRYQDLTAKTKDYEQLLEDALGLTQSRLDLFQLQIVGMRRLCKG